MIRLNLSISEVSNNLKKKKNELDVNGDTVARTDQIKFLGGYLDANLMQETYQYQVQDSTYQLE